jgi:hypothetical protein
MLLITFCCRSCHSPHLDAPQQLVQLLDRCLQVLARAHKVAADDGHACVSSRVEQTSDQQGTSRRRSSMVCLRWLGKQSKVRRAVARCYCCVSKSMQRLSLFHVTYCSASKCLTCTAICLLNTYLVRAVFELARQVRTHLLLSIWQCNAMHAGTHPRTSWNDTSYVSLSSSFRSSCFSRSAFCFSASRSRSFCLLAS